MSFSLDKNKYQNIIRSCEALQGLAGKNTLLLCNLTPSGLRIQSIDDKHHRTVLILNLESEYFNEFNVEKEISFACIVKELFVKENRKFNMVAYQFKETETKAEVSAETQDDFIGKFEISYDKMISELKVMGAQHGQSYVGAKPESTYYEFNLTNKLFLEQLKSLKDNSSDEILKFTCLDKTLLSSTSFITEATDKKPIELGTSELPYSEMYEISVDLELIYKTISKVKTLCKVTNVMLPTDSSRPVRLVLTLENTAVINYYMSPFGSV